jgi:hypothetical protein
MSGESIETEDVSNEDNITFLAGALGGAYEDAERRADDVDDAEFGKQVLQHVGEHLRGTDVLVVGMDAAETGCIEAAVEEYGAPYDVTAYFWSPSQFEDDDDVDDTYDAMCKAWERQRQNLGIEDFQNHIDWTVDKAVVLNMGGDTYNRVLEHFGELGVPVTKVTTGHELVDTDVVFDNDDEDDDEQEAEAADGESDDAEGDLSEEEINEWFGGQTAAAPADD